MSTISESFNLAQRFHQQGERTQAEVLYRQILKEEPSHTGALHWLGVLTCQGGHQHTGLALIRRSIALQPDAAGYYVNLGNALKNAGQSAEAAECYRHALRLQPHYAKAHNNLGNACMDQGNVAEAMESYREALRLNPELAIAHYNLGVALRDQNQLDKASVCFRQSIRIDPAYPDAHANLGIVLFHQGMHRDAAEAFERALKLDPERAEARFGRAILRLLAGDFENGWPDYEFRWEKPAVSPDKAPRRPVASQAVTLGFRPAPVRSFNQQRWDGANFAGKTILLYAEQGLGDTLQFIRYAPPVKQRGGTVVCECQPALARLLTGFPGLDEVIAAGRPLPAFDVQAPLLSLPGIFGTTLATIPPPVPCLSENPQRMKYWRGEMTRLLSNPDQTPTTAVTSGHDAATVTGSGLHVGIAWQGSTSHGKDRYRSVPLALFEPLARAEGVRLLSLQVGTWIQQVAAANFPVVDLGRQFNPDSLEDLAAAIVQLDLIITVDTAVAHLAGTLGKPVWVLIPFVPDWRWLLERADSPWYPTMRLFRQRQSEGWSNVIARVTAEVGVFHG